MTVSCAKNVRWIWRVSGALGLLGVLGCGSGGDSGADVGGRGRLSARVFWEQSDSGADPLAGLSGTAPAGGFGAELPAAVTTVRLDFAPAVGTPCCVAVDPSQLSVDPVTGRRSVVLSDIPVGAGFLTIAGFPGATAAAPVGATSHLCPRARRRRLRLRCRLPRKPELSEQSHCGCRPRRRAGKRRRYSGTCNPVRADRQPRTAPGEQRRRAVSGNRHDRDRQPRADGRQDHHLDQSGRRSTGHAHLLRRRHRHPVQSQRYSRGAGTPRRWDPLGTRARQRHGRSRSDQARRWRADTRRLRDQRRRGPITDPFADQHGDSTDQHTDRDGNPTGEPNPNNPPAGDAHGETSGNSDQDQHPAPDRRTGHADSDSRRHVRADAGPWLQSIDRGKPLDLHPLAPEQPRERSFVVPMGARQLHRSARIRRPGLEHVLRALHLRRSQRRADLGDAVVLAARSRLHGGRDRMLAHHRRRIPL